ncbi:MAG: 2-succinyl-5-enolpyruvyl-6-hydroxy-3-cyclohexene-1-carboxylic-acid synthase [Acidimicrobiia bacterium]|nr:MAG: 2-succinyl-5-enolpyruvyl-6-hydroxy-3-cyclohexene-1-carboxylic-acid synthase [Acidimicrobiia bacterium]
MTSTDETARYCTNLVAGLADAGVDTVFISPGSRNTPLILAFTADPRMRDISIRDERSAGFAALGYGKTTGRPAAVVCTSGSAATHYLPAVVEANQAGSPLIVLTADRPARLRGTGAPQTMNQIDLYGPHVKWFVDLDTTDPSGHDEGRLIATTAETLPAGPVHANVALDEPLVPDLLPMPRDPQEWIASDVAGTRERSVLGRLVGKNVLIVASGRQQAGFREAVTVVAQALNAPIIADPQCWVTGHNTVEYGDLLAGIDNTLDDNRPDVVLRLGPIATSKSLWAWLERSGVEQILVDLTRLTDPLGSATTVIEADPTVFLRANVPDTNSDRSFLDTWRAMDRTVGAAIAEAMAGFAFPSEPEVARSLVSTVPSGGIVYVGSSMPIRDVDTFANPRADITVIANRGVNGIDGTISSALGASLAGSPTTLLVGDVAALHDAAALSEVARLHAPLRIIVVNNDGGGIFSFLPQAESDIVDAPTFEKHWGTPHGLSLVAIAEAFGVAATAIDTLTDFIETVSAPIEGPSLIELTTNRDENVECHRALREAAGTALS